MSGLRWDRHTVHPRNGIYRTTLIIRDDGAVRGDWFVLPGRKILERAITGWRLRIFANLDDQKTSELHRRATNAGMYVNPMADDFWYVLLDRPVQDGSILIPAVLCLTVKETDRI